METLRKVVVREADLRWTATAARGVRSSSESQAVTRPTRRPSAAGREAGIGRRAAKAWAARREIDGDMTDDQVIDSTLVAPRVL